MTQRCPFSKGSLRKIRNCKNHAAAVDVRLNTKQLGFYKRGHLVGPFLEYIFTSAVSSTVLHLAWVVFLEPCRYQTPAHGGQNTLVHRSTLRKHSNHKVNTDTLSGQIRLLELCFYVDEMTEINQQMCVNIISDCTERCILLLRSSQLLIYV